MILTKVKYKKKIELVTGPATADQGKIVMVSALDGTYQRKGFPNILTLIPLAEHVVKLTAVCMLCL